MGLIDWITFEDPTYTSFGSDAIIRQEKYQKFLMNFDSDEEKCWEDMEHPQGNKEFLKMLIREKGRFMPRRRGGQRTKIESGTR